MNLKELTFKECNNKYKPNFLVNLPELEKLYLLNQIKAHMINYKSLQKLKVINSTQVHFLSLSDISLEDVLISVYLDISLDPYIFCSYDENYKILEKLSSIKTLKKLDFPLYYYIKYNDILKINNISVEDVTIDFCPPKSENIIYDFYDLQNKFSKTTNLNISISIFKSEKM